MMNTPTGIGGDQSSNSGGGGDGGQSDGGGGGSVAGAKPAPVAPGTAGGPATVLVVVCNPHQYNEGDGALPQALDEGRKVQEAFRRAGEVAVLLEHCTPVRLAQALIENPELTTIHFACHGDIVHYRDGGTLTLGFADEHGRLHFVEAATICTTLGAMEKLELVFFNGCKTFAIGLLLRKAHPRCEVVCWETKAADSHAPDFARAFYEARRSGRNVRRAFVLAKGKALTMRTEADPSWVAELQEAAYSTCLVAGGTYEQAAQAARDAGKPENLPSTVPYVDAVSQHDPEDAAQVDPVTGKDSEGRFACGIPRYLGRGHHDLKRLEIAYHDLDLDHTTRLGKGAFATVLKGTFKGRPIAAKIIDLAGVARSNTFKAQQAYARDFRNEVAVQSQLRSEFVVQVCGACFDRVGELILVMDLCNYGSLRQLLLLNGSAPARFTLTPAQCAGLLLDVARGMLACHSQGIIHRDLKPDNILLCVDDGKNGDLVAKIADFGTSKATLMATMRSKTAHGAGTMSYMSPEAHSLQQYTFCGDVFAFAVVTSEMISGGQMPWAGKSQPQIVLAVTNGCRPTITEDARAKAPGLCALAEECWKQDATERPAFDAIVRTLEALRSERVDGRLLPPVTHVAQPLSPEARATKAAPNFALGGADAETMRQLQELVRSRGGDFDVSTPDGLRLAVEKLLKEKGNEPDARTDSNVEDKRILELEGEVATLKKKNRIRELESDDLAPTPGRDIGLTVDAELQRAAIERFGDESGAAVVLDIETGAILAFVSTPAFDPNDFVNGISYADYNALRDNDRSPLYHKAYDGTYPPGSTFKMVVATPMNGLAMATV